MPQVLAKPLIVREVFDPKNKRHLASFDHFLRTGNWGDVQFEAEVPYVEVPMTVLMKFCRSKRDVQPESIAERAERLAARGVMQLPEQLSMKEQIASSYAALEEQNRRYGFAA